MMTLGTFSVCMSAAPCWPPYVEWLDGVLVLSSRRHTAVAHVCTSVGVTALSSNSLTYLSCLAPVLLPSTVVQLSCTLVTGPTFLTPDPETGTPLIVPGARAGRARL